MVGKQPNGMAVGGVYERFTRVHPKGRQLGIYPVFVQRKHIPPFRDDTTQSLLSASHQGSRVPPKKCAPFGHIRHLGKWVRDSKQQTEKDG